MLQTILGFLNFSVLLFFGIYVSASFLQLESTRKNHLILFGFGSVLNLLQLLLYMLIGMEHTQMLYPLVVHLPVVLLFLLVYKQKLLPVLLAIFSAYLCCQASKWFSILAQAITQENWVMYVVRIITNLILWYLIVTYASTSVYLIFSKPTKALLIFGILPVTYYLFDYIVTVYTNLLYSGSEVVFEFLPFLLCVTYLLFSMVYFKEYEEKRAAEQQKKLIEIQTAQSLKEIEEIKHSEYEISLIRHDMRHFLNTVCIMIENQEYETAQKYIHQIIEVTDKTALQKFCNNEMINLILSSYESRMKEKNIRFNASVMIPDKLPCSELDLTSILSNGLENAINAVLPLEENRVIHFKLCIKNGKLLLSIRNPYAKEPVFGDGLPITNANGHGLGAQSIRYITTKLHGNCQFTTEDGLFALRVVL